MNYNKITIKFLLGIHSQTFGEYFKYLPYFNYKKLQQNKKIVFVENYLCVKILTVIHEYFEKY